MERRNLIKAAALAGPAALAATTVLPVLAEPAGATTYNPVIWAFGTSDLTVNTGTWTAVSFNAFVDSTFSNNDPSTMPLGINFDTSTKEWVFPASAAGLYAIIAQVAWKADATLTTPGRRLVRISQAGTAVASSEIAGVSGDSSGVKQQQQVCLQGGFGSSSTTRIKIEVWQNSTTTGSSTSPVTCAADGYQAPQFMLARLCDIPY